MPNLVLSQNAAEVLWICRDNHHVSWCHLICAMRMPLLISPMRRVNNHLSSPTTEGFLRCGTLMPKPEKSVVNQDKLAILPMTIIQINVLSLWKLGQPFGHQVFLNLLFIIAFWDLFPNCPPPPQWNFNNRSYTTYLFMYRGPLEVHKPL